MNNKTRINKTFETGFALNKSKAVRINDIIETNIKKGNIQDINRTFKVLLSNEKEIIFHEFNSIFELDNGRKNRVNDVTLIWKNAEIDIEIQFRKKPLVSVDVSSNGLEWTNQLFAEIEEQIERITLTDWVYKFIADSSTILTILVLPIIIIFSTTIFSDSNDSIRTLNLTQEDKALLSNKIDSVKSNEDKIDFIYVVIKQMVKVKQPSSKTEILNETWAFFCDFKNYTIIIPILLSIFLIWYVLSYCYPKYVYEWGDMEEEYSKIIERRKNLWNILIGSIILGIITNFFVWGLTR